ncbi:MAG: response regulator transcription factor, partial [Flavisolibacter sp.]
MKKTKILYVEDEIFLAKIVGETLQSRGYDVVMEADGAKAMEVFNREKPDVCILDIMLPGKDGFMIADEIREKNLTVPIIFLSAKSQTTDVVNGFKLGANDYIRKPFSMEELIVRVENVMKNKTAPKEEVEEIVIGKYVFNLRRQTLHH